MCVTEIEGQTAGRRADSVCLWRLLLRVRKCGCRTHPVSKMYLLSAAADCFDFLIFRFLQIKRQKVPEQSDFESNQRQLCRDHENVLSSSSVSTFEGFLKVLKRL